MPHDKNGTLLTAGDRVALFGVILDITSEQPEYCNITLRPDEAMAPDAGPYDLALSARMVEKLDPLPSAIRHPPSAILPGLPYLYVEGFGASNPVLLSGAMSTQFLFDAALNRHVHRFASVADFEARAKQIILNGRSWKILTGLNPVDPVDPAAAAAAAGALEEIQRLSAELQEFDRLKDENAELRAALAVVTQQAAEPPSHSGPPERSEAEPKDPGSPDSARPETSEAPAPAAPEPSPAPEQPTAPPTPAPETPEPAAKKNRRRD